MARPFVDALKRHSREVAQLEGGQAEEFGRLLRGLQDELRGRLLGEHVGDDPLDAFRMRRILAETQAGLRVLDAKAAGFWDAAQRDALDLALEHVADEVRLLSGGLDATPFRVTLEAAKVWADPAHQLLANHFETSVQRYGADLLNDIRRRLFNGLRTGDPTRDIVADIAGKQGPLGPVGLKKAETLVRTEVSQAYGVAQHDGIAQADKKIPGGLQKMWLHIGSYQCPTCGPLHGTTRPLDGTWTIVVAKGPPRRVKRIAHAPAHPRCTCRVVASKPSWTKAFEKLGYLKPQKTDAEHGAAKL